MTALNILTSTAAVPFCNYDAHQMPVQVIDFELLKSGIQFAYEQNLDLYFIFAREPLPEQHLQLIEKTIHTKISPFTPEGMLEEVIPVFLEPGEVLESPLSEIQTAILKISASNILLLSPAISALLKRARRINLIKDLSGFNQITLKAYQKQLEKISNTLLTEYAENHGDKSREVNVLTDRLFLSKMNNCNAGITHITLAPDANYYPCPAFYYDTELRAKYKLNGKKEPENKYLLSFENAYICSACDCFHCQRCIYQNVTGTLEVNTPAKIQCQTAHAEREVSRRFRNRLLKKKIRVGTKLKKLNYDDPLDAILNRNIYTKQKEIA